MIMDTLAKLVLLKVVRYVDPPIQHAWYAWLTCVFVRILDEKPTTLKEFFATAKAFEGLK